MSEYSDACKNALKYAQAAEHAYTEGKLGPEEAHAASKVAREFAAMWATIALALPMSGDEGLL